MKCLPLLIAGVACARLHSNPSSPNLIYSDMKAESDENLEPTLEDMWGGYWPFQGISTFAHLEHHTCLIDQDTNYDLAVIGVPFDTATSYRPGARFGPRAIRAASQRQTSLRGYNQRANINPYTSWAKVIDCGDIPVTPMDNALAFKQMSKAFEELLHRRNGTNSGKAANDVITPPRYIALGGDHSVLLPHIRALHKIYGKLNILHFDAHLDTWAPDKYPSFWHSDQLELNHGSMLWKAHEEGLTTTHNVHAGLRTKLSGLEDYEDDDDQSFTRIMADDIWIDGVKSVIDKILEVIPANTPTYLSIDIDVLDPAFGSGTGTQEPGGWLPRELLHVLRSIDSLSIVGADIVEVSPAFDNAEITATNGAQVAFEILTSMVKKGPLGELVVDRLPEPVVEIFHASADKTEVDFAIEEKLKELEIMKEKVMKEIESMRNQV